MAQIEWILTVKGMRVPARLHGMGDISHYNSRMAAVEHASEHDDRQSMRALGKAVRALQQRCRNGQHPGRLTQVRQERRPNPRYASLWQYTYELRRAESMFSGHGSR